MIACCALVLIASPSERMLRVHGVGQNREGVARRTKGARVLPLPPPAPARRVAPGVGVGPPGRLGLCGGAINLRWCLSPPIRVTPCAALAERGEGRGAYAQGPWSPLRRVRYASITSIMEIALFIGWRTALDDRGALPFDHRA
ncbi:hypothetical protein Sp245p_16395 (plasmid) [Azospirillum baldaniorum]|uniref:Uncharacterized protein n=1 Tax=Azospirillum baldaniorum TaxID=1064539 RepID=A0A9P1JTV1_9PROT|nr:hypothetical protein Sp245p_16395 [Azospirillum baldaniorum]CCC99714.1 protein of unknown function [Azospirillum baldaniorum]